MVMVIMIKVIKKLIIMTIAVNSKIIRIRRIMVEINMLQ